MSDERIRLDLNRLVLVRFDSILQESSRVSQFLTEDLSDLWTIFLTLKHGP